MALVEIKPSMSINPECVRTVFYEKETQAATSVADPTYKVGLHLFPSDTLWVLRSASLSEAQEEYRRLLRLFEAYDLEVQRREVKANVLHSGRRIMCLGNRKEDGGS